MALTVTSVSRTPSLIVVRGHFDGMSAAQIQALGRPDILLGNVASESGQLGFGEGYRDFEFRFPAIDPGPAVLRLNGFDGAAPPTSPTSLAIRIP